MQECLACTQAFHAKKSTVPNTKFSPNFNQTKKKFDIERYYILHNFVVEIFRFTSIFTRLHCTRLAYTATMNRLVSFRFSFTARDVCCASMLYALPPFVFNLYMNISILNGKVIHAIESRYTQKRRLSYI